MDIRFDGQVIIVTGGGRSLGREYSLEIARRGGSVVIADIGGAGSAEGAWADHVVAEIEAFGGKAMSCLENIATSAGANAVIERAVEKYGRVDAVIHNAGFLRPAFISDLTDEQIVDVVGVHLLGAFYMARPAWKVMKKQGYGRFVLVGSSAIFGNMANANYSAAKSGIIGLTMTLALEGEEDGIVVNAVMPMAESTIEHENPIPTKEIELCREAVGAMSGRRGTQWVSALVSYLASDSCSVSGRIYSAFSGRYARVYPAIGSGWLSESLPTAEQVGQNIGAIDRTDNAAVPMSMVDEIQSVYGILQENKLI